MYLEVVHGEVKFFGYISTYNFVMCTRLLSRIFYFPQSIKINERNIEERKIVYILHIICHKFYFGELQEMFLGQDCSQGIFAPSQEDLSVYHCSVPEKKQAGRLRTYLCR